jgi:hypothetical protein
MLPVYHFTENGGLEMKRLLVLMMMLVLTLGLAGCGGGDASDSASDAGNTPEPNALVEVTGNGLNLSLPADIKYIKTDENNGGMIYSNEERNAVVVISVKTEDAEVSPADISDDVLLTALAGEGSLSDVALDSSDTVEQDGGTYVVGFGKGSLEDGTVMNNVLQYFFPADGGGYYVISYLYGVDAESSLDDTIQEVVSTVKTAQ